MSFQQTNLVAALMMIVSTVGGIALPQSLPGRNDFNDFNIIESHFLSLVRNFNNA